MSTHPMVLYLARTRGCQGCACYVGPRVGPDGLARTVLGECRLAPPRTSSDHRWPKVAGDDFCGSWQPVMVPERNGCNGHESDIKVGGTD